LQKKLFITDFDGTLLRDDKTICPKDLNALKKLEHHGIVRCIATGRSIYSFLKILKTFGLNIHKFPVDYLIFSTGACIMESYNEEIIKSFSLEEADVILIANYFETCRLDYMVHKPVPDTNYFVYKHHGGKNSDFKARIEIYKEYVLPLEQNMDSFGRATQVLSIIPCKSSYASFERIEKIKKDLGKYSVIIATSPLDHESLWVEVFNKEVSKSKAAAFLSNKLSIKRENVISIGNDSNDMDLLLWSGKGFVVANALDDLKQEFEQLPSNNNCGVCTAVEKCIKA